MKQTCWERESGTVGMATDAPCTAPPREKVKLWEALSVACWLVRWWLTPPIRSKSSAEGETGSGFEGRGDWASLKRSLTAWAGPELDKVGGLAEKAFQSPNSPFPLDDGAAEESIFNPSLSNVSFRVKFIFLVYEKVAVNVYFWGDHAYQWSLGGWQRQQERKSLQNHWWGLNLHLRTQPNQKRSNKYAVATLRLLMCPTVFTCCSALLGWRINH